MRTVVPFDVSDPKTRLASVLTPDERRSFARAMLADVVHGLRKAGAEPEVLATEPIDCNLSTTVDDRSLDTAVNDVLRGTEGPIAVVMADLALGTPDAFAKLLGIDADIVLAPGRGGGTNALVVRHSDFRVNYHGASIRDHRRIASELTDDVAQIDSFRLATDVDEPVDLAEVLLHTDGDAATWLREREFELTVADGRVGVTRDPD